MEFRGPFSKNVAQPTARSAARQDIKIEIKKKNMHAIDLDPFFASVVYAS